MTYSPNVEFGDVFYEFADIRSATDALLPGPVDDSWWAAFDSLKGNVKAAALASDTIDESPTLSPADSALRPILRETLAAYSKAFDVVSAARDSADFEILNYAIGNFTEEITAAEGRWDIAMAEAAALETSSP